MRALKFVLASAANKRERINQIKTEMTESGENFNEFKITENLSEPKIQSVCEKMEPKLVADDIPLLSSLLNNHISGLKDVIMELVLKSYMVKSEEPVHKKMSAIMFPLPPGPHSCVYEVLQAANYLQMDVVLKSLV